MPIRQRANALKPDPARLPALAVLAILIISGAGAATGLLMKDRIDGDNSIGVSQAILIVGVDECADSDADEFLATVNDEGTAFNVYFEANNGDIVCYNLKVANEADQIVVAKMHIHGGSPYTFGSDPLFWWSDTDGDGEISAGEMVILTEDTILDRADEIKAPGSADFMDFDPNHWFFDGSYSAAGTYGPTNQWGPASNDDIFSDYDGTTPEAIMLDGATYGVLAPGILDGTGAAGHSSDAIITAGKAGLAQDTGAYGWSGTPSVSTATGRLHFYDTSGDGAWQAGEDLFLNNDGDGYFTGQADDLIDEDGSTIGGVNGDQHVSVAGTRLTGFDGSDDVYWFDQGTLKRVDDNDAVWMDAADDGIYNAHGMLIAGIGLTTNLTSLFDAQFNIDLNGGKAPADTTLTLENSGYIEDETLTTIGLEMPSIATSGTPVKVTIGPDTHYYILNALPVSNGQLSTAQLIGNDYLAGDALKGKQLEQVTIGAPSSAGAATTYWADHNHDNIFQTSEAVVGGTDTTLEEADAIVNSGSADLTLFPTTHLYWDANGDNIYTDGEAILINDGDAILDIGIFSSTNADSLVTIGKVPLGEDLTNDAGHLVFYDPGANGWTSGDDIVLNYDGDAYYTTAADVLVDGDGYATTGPGSATAITAGDTLTAFEAGDKVYWKDFATAGTFDGTDMLWYDDGADGRYAASGASLSGASPSTDLSSIFDASLKIAFNGAGATTYYLENSGAIPTTETAATIGLEAAPGSSVGDPVKFNGIDSFYIVLSVNSDGERSTLSLLGEDTIAGQTIADVLTDTELLEQKLTSTTKRATVNGFYVDADHSNTYTSGEALVRCASVTLASSCTVYSNGDADFADFTDNYDLFADGDDGPGTDDNGYNDGEAIFYDDNGDGVMGPGLLNAGNFRLKLSGDADLHEDLGPVSTGKIVYFNSANAGWQAGEDIFLNLDGDGYYTSAADTLVDGNGNTDNTAGTASGSPSAGDTLTAFEAADNVYWNDQGTSGSFDSGGGGGQVIEDFETGTGWVWSPWTGSTGTVSTSYAHDGSYGLSDPSWPYRTDVSVGNDGDQLSWWVRPSSSSGGRAYLGFGSSAGGTWAFTLATNTNQLIIHQVNSYSSYDIKASTSYSGWSANTWYKAVAEFSAASTVTGKLYASDGTTLLEQVQYSGVTGLPGGISIRSFNSWSLDTFISGSPGDDLWYDASADGLFAASGASISGTNPSTDLSTIYDAGLNIAFDGGAASAYVLENSGAITASALSTLGLEDVASFTVGDVVKLGSNYYIVTALSADLDQRSTLQLIGDVAVVGDNVKGGTITEQTLTLGAPVNAYTNGAQSIGVGGTKALTIDDNGPSGGDASDLDAGEIWALVDNGFTETAFVTNFDIAHDVQIADIDQDGDLDLLGAAQGDDDVAWFENTAGTGSVRTTHIIHGSFPDASSVQPVDVDGDGDLDVVAGSGGTSGTLYDHVAWFENDDLGKALNFDGVNEFVTMSADAVPNPASLTVEAWVKVPSGGGGRVVTKSDGLGVDSLRTFEMAASTQLSVELFTGTNGYYPLTSTTTFAADTWNHLAFTADDATKTLSLYVNGAFDRSTTYAGTIRASAEPVHVGKNDWHTPSYFRGSIDEIRVWDTTLSQDTLSSWMNKELNNGHPNYASNLKAYYMFNEGSGTSAYDSSGENHPGTLYNMEAGDWIIDPTQRWGDHIIDSSANDAYSVHSADVDNDGDQDVLAATYGGNEIAWYENDDFNKALDLDGTDEYVSVPALSTSNDLTIEAWVKADTIVASGYDTIYSMGGLMSPTGRVDFKLKDGGFLYFLVQEASPLFVTSDVKVGTGTWNHVAVVYDYISGSSATYTFYINGLKAGSGTDSSPATIASTAGNLGSHYTGGTITTDYLDGKLDEVRIYGAALSQSTLQSWMHRDIDGDHPNWGDMKAYYQFHTGSGTTAKDSKGSNDGTLINMEAGDWVDTTVRRWDEHLIDGSFSQARLVETGDLDNDGDLDVLGAAQDDDDVTWWENIGLNKGLEFDGVDDYVSVPDNAVFDISSAITLEAWIKADSNQPAGKYGRIIDHYENVDKTGYSLNRDQSDNTLLFEFWDTTNTHRSVKSTSTITDDAWHHVAATYDGSIMRIYIDGVEENTNAIGAVSIQASDNVVQFGGGSDDEGSIPGVSHWFKGLIDEARIWNTAVSGTNLASWMKRELDNSHPNDASLVGYWKFNDGSGTMASDSEASNDGTLTNMRPSDWVNSRPMLEHLIDGAFDGASSVDAADIDGDGNLDVLATAKIANTVAWWENDGAPADGGWTKRTIDSSFVLAHDAQAVDIDLDGDLDVIGAASTDDDVTWFENANGVGTSWYEHTVDGNFDSAIAVVSGDMDGDGDPDVISAGYLADAISWWKNPLNKGSMSWGTQSTITTNADDARSIHAADLDNDGDLDVLSASFGDNTIAWYESNGGDNPTFVENIITSDSTYALQANSVYASDLDNDGDLDVLWGGVNLGKIYWAENDGAADPTFSAPQLIDNFANGFMVVYASDVDSDGDMDVLSANWYGDDIAWFENTAGDGSAWTESTITSSADMARYVRAGDLDCDGDMDVVSASFNDDKIAWYENDGSESFTARTITSSADGADSVRVADVDSDGDLDVLSSSANDNKIAWYENQGGSPLSWSSHTISTAAIGANDVFAFDMDQDGDIDVLSVSETDDKVAWYENDGSQSFTARIISTSADKAIAIDVGDIDGDGDPDVISASATDDRVAWYENTQTRSYTTTGYFVMDDDGTASDASQAILGTPSMAIPDNAQFFAVSLVDSATIGDLDDVYLDSGADIAAEIDAKLDAALGADDWADHDVITGKYRIDSSTTGSSSAVVVTAATTGTNVADDLKLGAAQGALDWSYTTSADVGSVSISGDGNYLASASLGSDKIYFFSRSSSTPQWNYAVSGVQHTGLEVSSDGTYIAVGDANNKLHFFERTSGTPQWSYSAGHNVGRVGMSDDGNYIAAGMGWQASAKTAVFDKSGNTPLWTDSGFNENRGTAISGDGNYVAATGGTGGTGWFYHYKRTSNTREMTVSLGSEGRSVAISNDGLTIANGYSGGLKLYDGATKTTSWTKTGMGVVESLAMSSNGEYIVAGSLNNNIYLFDKSSSTPIWSYTAGGQINQVAMTPDGHYIAAASYDDNIYLFSRSSSTPLWTYTTGADLRSVDLSNDGQYVVAGGYDDKVYVLTSTFAGTEHTGGDKLLRGSPTEDVTIGNNVVTGSGYPFTFDDADTCGGSCTASNSAYEIGQDIYEETTHSSLTYSSAADTLLYNGGTTNVVASGSAATAFVDSDNIMYLDLVDHDSAYDVGEPLIKTDSDINNDGDLTAGSEVLVRNDAASWLISPLDLNNFASNLDFVDVNDDDTYDGTQAIVRNNGDAGDLEQTTDTVVTSGLANLIGQQYVGTSGILVLRIDDGGLDEVDLDGVVSAGELVLLDENGDPSDGSAIYGVALDAGVDDTNSLRIAVEPNSYIPNDLKLYTGTAVAEGSSSNVDDFYLDSGADIAAAIQDEIGASGTSAYDTSADFEDLFKIDSASTAGGSAVVVSMDTEFSIGSPGTFNSADSRAIDSAFDPDTNKVVTLANGKVYVGTVSGNSISYGAGVEIYSNHGAYPSVGVAIDPHTSGRVAFTYSSKTNADGVHNDAWVRVGTISDNTITNLGTPVKYGDNWVISSARGTFTNNANEMVLTSSEYLPYPGGTYGRNGMATVATLLPDNSVSLGSEVKFDMGVIQSDIAYDPDTDQVIIAYADDNGAHNRGLGKAVVGKVSETSISFGSISTFDTTDMYSPHLVYDTAEDKMVIAYSLWPHASRGVVATVSTGKSISFGSPVSLGVGTNWGGLAPTYDSTSGNLVVAGGSGYVREVTVSGDSLSLGNSAQYSPNGVATPASTYDSTNNKFVISYSDSSESYYGKSVVGELRALGVADDLKLGTANSGTEWVGGDRVLRGSPTEDVTMGNNVITGASYPFAFNDADTCGGSGCTTAGVYNVGEDIYQEQTYGSLTYTDQSDLIVYNGGATEVQPGYVITTFTGGDNVMYVDGNHDSDYDVGEALLLTATDVNIGDDLPSSTTVLARADGGGTWVPSAQDLTSFPATDKYTDGNGNNAYTDGEAIVRTADFTLDAADTVVTDGDADLVASQTIGATGIMTLSIDDGAGATVDLSGLAAGSLLLVDDDGNTGTGTPVWVVTLDAGGAAASSLRVAGAVGKTIPVNYNLYSSSFIITGNPLDVDDYFLDDGDEIGTAINTAMDEAFNGGGGGVNWADYVNSGPYNSIAGYSGRYRIDSALTTSTDSAVSVSSTSGVGTNVAIDLRLRLSDLAVGFGPDRYFANAANPTLATPMDDVTTGAQVVTSLDMPLAYNDWDDDAGAGNVNDGNYDEGQDIYQEDTGGALTYTPASTIPETVVYVGADGQQAKGGNSGAGPGTAGSAATYLESGDNVWYRDHDHDTVYDLGEFLIVSSNSDLDPTDEVLLRADGGGDWTISNGNDLYRLETDYNGGNPGGLADNHNYQYIDDNDNDRYDDGEAIVDHITGTDVLLLEEADFIIHHGLADLVKLPMAAAASGSVIWKFQVPSVNDRNNPLEVEVKVYLEDAAETGWYEISTDIRPVNV